MQTGLNRIYISQLVPAHRLIFPTALWFATEMCQTNMAQNVRSFATIFIT